MPLFILVATTILVAGLQAQFTTIQYHDGPNSPYSEKSAIANAGDVNGDGTVDIIVGSPGEPSVFGFGGEFGRVQVFSGADGSSLFDILGQDFSDNFGSSVAGVGDVNNDGRDDFIVGIPNDTFNGATGSAKVFSGLDGSVLYYVLGFAPAGATGAAVTGLGDVNNDGHADFAVASVFVGTGLITVYSGISGTTLYSTFGAGGLDVSIANAGDVNGDGINDLIVGGPARLNNLNQSVGMVSILSGSNGALLRTLFGTNIGSRMGESVDGAGDLDHDGFADFIVGEPGKIAPGVGQVGRARVFSGSTGAPLRTLLGTSSSIVGRAVSGLGDADGDGTVDFAVSVEASLSAPASFIPVIRVYSGAGGSVLGTLPTPESSQVFAQKVAKVGDINSDGLADVLVGSFQQFTRNGEARLYASGIVPLSLFQSNSGNAPILNLAWQPSHQHVNNAAGRLLCGGATPGAVGLILASLAPADIPVLGFDLLAAVDSTNLLLSAGLGANFAGEFIVDGVSRRLPSIAGTALFVQFIETNPVISASNGICFVAIP